MEPTHYSESRPMVDNDPADWVVDRFAPVQPALGDTVFDSPVLSPSAMVEQHVQTQAQRKKEEVCWSLSNVLGVLG